MSFPGSPFICYFGCLPASSSRMAFKADMLIRITTKIIGNPSTIANFCIRLSPPVIDSAIDSAKIMMAQLKRLYKCGS